MYELLLYDIIWFPEGSLFANRGRALELKMGSHEDWLTEGALPLRSLPADILRRAFDSRIPRMVREPLLIQAIRAFQSGMFVSVFRYRAGDSSSSNSMSGWRGGDFRMEPFPRAASVQ